MSRWLPGPVKVGTPVHALERSCGVSYWRTARDAWAIYRGDRTGTAVRPRRVRAIEGTIVSELGAPDCRVRP